MSNVETEKKIVFSPWFRSSIRSYRNESQVRVESLQGKIFTKGFVYRSTCKVVSQRQKCYACLTRNLNCGNDTRCIKHFCIRIKPRRNFLCCLREMLGNLSNDDSDFNVYGKKTNRFRLAKQQLCRHCTTTTWKCLIWHFTEDVITRRWLSFSFPQLRYSLLELNSRKNCRHLTNWTRWSAIKFEAARLHFSVTFSSRSPLLLL